MIKIDHLSKKYNDNVVLDDISLEIKQGDVVGIIGPSGCLLYTSDAADE